MRNAGPLRGPTYRSTDAVARVRETRVRFSQLLEGLRPDDDYPGVYPLGFVARDRVDAHAAALRQVIGATGNGLAYAGPGEPAEEYDATGNGRQVVERTGDVFPRDGQHG